MFEELRGNQELADFFDLVNSPPSNAVEIDGEPIQGSATKTILSTLDPIKSLTLNVLVRESSKGDSQCKLLIRQNQLQMLFWNKLKLPL